jgi:dynein heavy chain, axonemal
MTLAHCTQPLLLCARVPRPLRPRAQADLAVAMPALEKALSEVDKLDKNAITEVKAYSKPPPLVETVLAAVMVLFGKSTDWATAKQVLGRGDFLQSIKGYDKDNVSSALMNKVSRPRSRGKLAMRSSDSRRRH